MQVFAADPMSISASAQCDSEMSGLEDRQNSVEDRENSLQNCLSGEGLLGKASFSSISGCSSSSSHSTLSVDAANELQEVRELEEQSEHSSGFRGEPKERYHNCCPRNLLKFSKRVTGKARRAQTYRTVYARPLSADNSTLISKRLFNAPSAEEIDDFFAQVEDKFQHKSFIERYNFDVVNDLPLPGRYEWVKVQE